MNGKCFLPLNEIPARPQKPWATGFCAQKGRDFRAAYGFYSSADLWFDMFSSPSSLLFSSAFFQDFLCLTYLFFWGSITFSSSLHHRAPSHMAILHGTGILREIQLFTCDFPFSWKLVCLQFCRKITFLLRFYLQPFIFSMSLPYRLPALSSTQWQSIKPLPTLTAFAIWCPQCKSSFLSGHRHQRAEWPQPNKPSQNSENP